jgi:hypothetical protein
VVSGISELPSHELRVGGSRAEEWISATKYRNVVTDPATASIWATSTTHIARRRFGKHLDSAWITSSDPVPETI